MRLQPRPRQSINLGIALATNDTDDATSSPAVRLCAICGTTLDGWRPRTQKYCSEPCRAAAVKKRRAERPKAAPKVRRPKPTLTAGTPPVPDPARTRKVHGDSYWSPILAAAERATGGEPCRICAEPIPAGAPWSYRDRHVCSNRCNGTLKRRTASKIRRGEIDLGSIPDLGNRASADAEHYARFQRDRPQ